MRPTAQYSGGWFLDWHNNYGGIVIWPKGSLHNGYKVAQGGNIYNQQLLNLGDRLQICYSTGAGEAISEAVRLNMNFADMAKWERIDLTTPDGSPGTSTWYPVNPTFERLNDDIRIIDAGKSLVLGKLT